VAPVEACVLASRFLERVFICLLFLAITTPQLTTIASPCISLAPFERTHHAAGAAGCMCSGFRGQSNETRRSLPSGITLEQTTANQERELRQVAGRTGCEIVKVYKDHGISGTKGRDKRPAFDALCRDAAKRQFDMVMAWSVDRLGRSLQDLVGFLSELHALRIDLFLHQQGLDTTTPAGKALFQMMGVFAEFERAMIQERVRAGLARARSEGKRLAGLL
jgi:hypothetical protein